MDYERQGLEFLRRNKISMTIKHKGDKCPLWCDGGCKHGERHVITFSRIINEAGHKKSMRISYWNSLNDVMNEKRVKAYDVLSVMTKYNPGSLDDFIGELGYSKGIGSTYTAVKKEWIKVKEFFTGKEITELQEIN